MNMNTFAVGQPVYNFIILSLEETASQHNLEVANMLGEEDVNDKWRSSATEELGFMLYNAIVLIQKCATRIVHSYVAPTLNKLIIIIVIIIVICLFVMFDDVVCRC